MYRHSRAKDVSKFPRRIELERHTQRLSKDVRPFNIYYVSAYCTKTVIALLKTLRRSGKGSSFQSPFIQSRMQITVSTLPHTHFSHLPRPPDYDLERCGVMIRSVETNFVPRTRTSDSHTLEIRVLLQCNTKWMPALKRSNQTHLCKMFEFTKNCFSLPLEIGHHVLVQLLHKVK